MSEYLDGVGNDTCGFCSKKRTPEGHDGCIGTLKGVKNACCGHGKALRAYVQFDHRYYHLNPNLLRIADKKALEYIENHKTI